MWMNCTVTVQNILYLDELWKWALALEDQYKKPIGSQLVFEVAHQPFYIHMNLLSDNLKDEASRRIDAMINTGKLTKKQVSDLTGICKIMYTTPERSDAHTIFKNYIRNLDRIRNETWSDVFPEMKEMLNGK